MIITSSVSISQETLHYCDFDTQPINYTTGADARNSWEFGSPNGGRGVFSIWWFNWEVGNPDPTKDHTSDNDQNFVAGQGLQESSATEGESGYFNSATEWLMTPAIDCGNYQNIILTFYRWANFANSDSGIVEISTDGENWIDLSQPNSPTDTKWTEVVIDISYYANEQSEVYIRWKSVSNSNFFYSGWNIDDVKIIGSRVGQAVWTGNISSDWNNPNNWDNNFVPININPVKVPSNTLNTLTINSTVSCYSLTIDPNATVVIDEGGVLNVDQDIKISSYITSTGSLLNNGDVNVLGNSIFETFISQDSWSYISSPLTGVDPELINANAYYWNESAAADLLNRGWYLKKSELLPLEGYDLKSDNGGIIQLIGDDFVSGDVNINISHTIGDSINGFEGWNLLGNPYPCMIDWEAISDEDRSQMGNALYIWDPQTEIYSTYINGVGINGGSRYIQPGQAFFIKKSEEGTAQITFTNYLKTTGGSSNQKSFIQPNLRIISKSKYYSDEIIVRFIDGANVNFEKEFDAKKRFSTNKFVPQIYTLTESSDQLAINTLPISTEHTSIPLYFRVGVAGDYSLNFSGLTMLGTRPVVLEDLLTGELININETSTYNFVVNSPGSTNRFVLHYNMPLSVTFDYQNVSCKGENDGSASLNILGGVWPVSIEWSNGLDTDNISKLSPGKYNVKVIDASNASVIKQIIITEPKGIDYEIQKMYPTSDFSIDGSIILLVENNDLSYNVEWSTGEVSDHLFNVGEGDYSFSITDENGCVTSNDISLKKGEEALSINFDYNEWVNIYSFNKTVIVNILDQELLNGSISIYEITGRIISTQNFYNPGEYSIDIKNGSGIYIVEVSTIDKKIVNKIQIQ